MFEKAFRCSNVKFFISYFFYLTPSKPIYSLISQYFLIKRNITVSFCLTFIKLNEPIT